MSPAGGLFLSFEGIEGSGKTTQIRLLREWLEEQGRTVLAIREPGGTPLSESIRQILLRPESGPIDEWAELCLYEAARAQLVRDVIRPALASGALVVADRFSDASVAYQGGGRGLGVAPVRLLNRFVTRDLKPRWTFLLDLDPRIGLERARVRGQGALDRLEREPLAFHRRVRRAYLRMAAREPDRIRVLDASLSADELSVQIQTHLRPHL